MRISQGVIAVAFLLLLAAPAQAEVITLICGSPANYSTYDIDLTKQTVYSVGGNPPRTVRAEITSRFITWQNPYVGWMHRIDRTTRYFYTSMPEHPNWQAGPSGNEKCERASGDILRN